MSRGKCETGLLLLLVQSRATLDHQVVPIDRGLGREVLSYQKDRLQRQEEEEREMEQKIRPGEGELNGRVLL